MSTDKVSVPATSTTMIEFTPAMVLDLERNTRRAEEAGVTIFVWCEHEFVTRYAKYLVEYLRNEMGITESCHG